MVILVLASWEGQPIGHGLSNKKQFLKAAISRLFLFHPIASYRCLKNKAPLFGNAETLSRFATHNSCLNTASKEAVFSFRATCSSVALWDLEGEAV